MNVRREGKERKENKRKKEKRKVCKKREGKCFKKERAVKNVRDEKRKKGRRLVEWEGIGTRKEIGGERARKFGDDEVAKE